MGKKTEISDQQRALIDRYGVSGYSSKRIVQLGIPELSGLGWYVIHEVLRENGHINLRRSEGIKGVGHIKPERRAEIAAFISETRGKVPNRKVGAMFGISPRTAADIRIATIGRTGHAPGMSAEGKKSKRAKLDKGCGPKRMKKFMALLLMRQRHASDPNVIPRPCRVCRRPWFRSKVFYDNHHNEEWFIGQCRICRAEIVRLRSRGVPGAEAKRIVAKYNWLPAKSTHEALLDRFRDDSTHRCADPLVRCNRCERQWYWNSRYFHTAKDNSRNLFLLDVCLGCPG